MRTRGSGVPVRGALVYASPGDRSLHRYRMDGDEIAVASIDLSQPWNVVHSELISLLDDLAHPSVAREQRQKLAPRRLVDSEYVMEGDGADGLRASRTLWAHAAVSSSME